ALLLLALLGLDTEILEYGDFMAHLRPGGRVRSVLKWEGIIIDPIGAVLASAPFGIKPGRRRSSGRSTTPGSSRSAKQLHDRFARGDRPGTHSGVERHPKRMIQGGTEVLRPDRMVLHVGADLVGRAIDAAADAGACEQCGKACRP